MMNCLKYIGSTGACCSVANAQGMHLLTFCSACASFIAVGCAFIYVALRFGLSRFLE